MRTTSRVLGAAVTALGAVLTVGCGTSATPPPTTVTVTASTPPVSTPAPSTPLTTTASPAPARDGDVPRCTTGVLRATLGAAEGAAGSVFRPLVFTNAGSRPCALRGFPGVSYVTGDDGHQVGEAARETGERGGEVTLRPGGRAAASVQFVQVANFDAAACRPTPVRGLRVYPPGDTASLFVPAEGTGCAGTPPGPQLAVRTITAA